MVSDASLLRCFGCSVYKSRMFGMMMKEHVICKYRNTVQHVHMYHHSDQSNQNLPSNVDSAGRFAYQFHSHG